MDMFSSLRMWLRKGFHIKRTSIFNNLWLPVVHSPHSPSFDSPNIPVYEIYSWKNGNLWSKNVSHNFIHWKHVRKYLQQICSSLLWISFAFDYICWLAILYMCDFWCQTRNTFIKTIRYMYKMILITQTVVWLHTTVIFDTRQMELASLCVIIQLNILSL